MELALDLSPPESKQTRLREMSHIVPRRRTRQLSADAASKHQMTARWQVL